MSLPVRWVLVGPLARFSHKRNNLITALIIGGLVLILLFSLLTLAMPALEEAFEQDDIPSVELGIIGEWQKHFLAGTGPLGLDLGMCVPSMRLLYLRGHIGEKRFVDSRIRCNDASQSILLLVAALFYRAVFLLFASYVLFRQARTAKSSPEINTPDLVQRKPFISRSFITMQGIIQHIPFKEKLLIQGDS